jgi:hypothetical protein
MTSLGWLGVALLVAGSLAIVVEGAMMAIWALAVSKRSTELAERLASERRLLESDVERLRLAIEETRGLWDPYRRALRWLSHPLVIALLQSFRRRASAR